MFCMRISCWVTMSKWPQFLVNCFSLAQTRFVEIGHFGGGNWCSHWWCTSGHRCEYFFATSSKGAYVIIPNCCQHAIICIKSRSNTLFIYKSLIWYQSPEEYSGLDSLSSRFLLIWYFSISGVCKIPLTSWLCQVALY